MVAPVHVKLQAPLLHVAVLLAGCEHAAQIAPALPHWVAVSLAYAMQLPPTALVQHPFGHVWASQTHWPCELHS